MTHGEKWRIDVSVGSSKALKPCAAHAPNSPTDSPWPRRSVNLKIGAIEGAVIMRVENPVYGGQNLSAGHSCCKSLPCQGVERTFRIPRRSNPAFTSQA